MNNSNERSALQPKINESFESLKPYSTESSWHNAIINAVA